MSQLIENRLYYSKNEQDNKGREWVSIAVVVD
jgi:hypothetical protein